jgi:hypothetical protein
MRKDGFYWIRTASKWRVAEFTGGVWYLAGIESGFSDYTLEEIDERRLTK